MQLLKAKVNIDKFLPHVQANTMGSESEGMLPDGAALSFIRNSVISFAEKSGIITTKLKVDLQCGMNDYFLEDLSGETIIGVKKAKLGNFEIEDCGTAWSWGNVHFKFDDDLLHVHPTPSKDVQDGLQVEAVVIPNREACEVDEQFFTKWFDAIVSGALKEIHLMPNRPWSSVSRADYRRRQFEDDVSRASVRRVLDGHRAPMQATANPDWMPCASYQRRKW